MASYRLPRVAKALLRIEPASRATVPRATGQNYICASCHATAVRSRHTTSRTDTLSRTDRRSPAAQRTLHTTPVQRSAQSQQLPQSHLHDDDARPGASDPLSTLPTGPSHYDFFPATFPGGAPPASPFSPDLKALRREFLALQARAHPDVAGGDAAQRRRAEALSTRINEAYRTLQDPLRRAVYLLAEQGVDVDDEGAKLDGVGDAAASDDAELLLEVMEAREQLEDVVEEAELGALREANDARVQQSVQLLEESFAGTDLPAAARETIRLRYWMNIEQSIAGWEPGNGGGLVHH